VERESGFQMARMGEMRLTLRNPDFTTARRIAEAVNTQFPGVASADNPTIVTLRPPPSASMADFISRIENLPVEPDTAARVVVDEASGTIVMGADVRISTVAVAQGSISITVDENPQVSQPAPESLGQTVVTPASTVRVNEDRSRHMMVLRSGASLATLVSGLNSLGVTPREIISILQAIRAAGALQAEIEVM
jgi:flagellar P-ring protein precursor FlgI